MYNKYFAIHVHIFIYNLRIFIFLFCRNHSKFNEMRSMLNTWYLILKWNKKFISRDFEGKKFETFQSQRWRMRSRELFTLKITRNNDYHLFLSAKMTQRVEQSATVARRSINIKEKNIAPPIFPSHWRDFIPHSWRFSEARRYAGNIKAKKTWRMAESR